jgi:hypothetical protein
MICSDRGSADKWSGREKGRFVALARFYQLQRAACFEKVENEAQAPAFQGKAVFCE